MYIYIAYCVCCHFIQEVLCCVVTPQFIVASLTIDYELVTEILLNNMKHVAGGDYDNYTCTMIIIHVFYL